MEGSQPQFAVELPTLGVKMNLLTALAGAGIGLCGQGLRALLGAWKRVTNAKDRTPFDIRRFLLSMVFGAIAGFLAGLLVETEIKRTEFFMLFGAGYAGADAIEGILAKPLSALKPAVS